jgi:hypothetical protein
MPFIGFMDGYKSDYKIRRNSYKRVKKSELKKFSFSTHT